MDIWLLLCSLAAILLSVIAIVVKLTKKGQPGQNGNQGPAGQTGPQGPQPGPMGPTGMMGITGQTNTSIGAMGPTGQMGPTGAGGGITGNTGLVGYTGQTGYRGPQGPASGSSLLNIYYLTNANTTDTIGAYGHPLNNAYYFCPKQGGTINLIYDPQLIPAVGSSFVIDMYWYEGKGTTITNLTSTTQQSPPVLYNGFSSILYVNGDGKNTNNMKNAAPQPFNKFPLYQRGVYTFVYIGDYIVSDGTIVPNTYMVITTGSPFATVSDKDARGGSQNTCS